MFVGGFGNPTGTPPLVAPPDAAPIAEALRAGLLGRLVGADDIGTADTETLLELLPR